MNMITIIFNIKLKAEVDIMIELLAKLFIKDVSDVNSSKVRQGYGRIGCIVGIVLNIILFAGKYIAGVISHSVAITADSFNNLSDAGSSVITLIGFQMAGKKADLEHPFGHGRVEYLSGLAVSAMIIIMGAELFRTSVEKILHPQAVDTSLVSFGILLAAIVVKLYMAFYNKKIGEKINSSAMKATAADSFSDAAATMVVFFSMLVTRFAGINVDGICGVIVSVFILRAGYGAAKDTLSPLLGQAPEPELVNAIREIVMSYEKVAGMHDLVVHDYGPGRCMLSLHVEIPGDENVYEMHDMIERIEGELKERLDCEAVIHMDPIDVNDAAVREMRAQVAEKIEEWDSRISIHDFRMVKGPAHTKIIFDVVLPQEFDRSEEEVRTWITEVIKENFENVSPVIKVERSYT